MKRRWSSLLILFIAMSCMGQVSKKEAVEKNIKTIAEWETDLKSRKQKPIQESFIKYDKMGNVTEIVERDNDGIVTLHEKYEFDQKGNKTTEYQLNEEGALKKKHVYTYSNNLKVSRKTYNGSDKLIAEKKYIYEFYTK